MPHFPDWVSDLKGKKLLFLGPAPTKDKKDLDVNVFDYVIITNNAITTFFARYRPNSTTRVIAFVNRLYSNTHPDRIRQHAQGVAHWLSVHSPSDDALRLLANAARVKSEDIGCVGGGHSLGLNKVLKWLKASNAMHSELHITGATFYREGAYSRNIHACYEPEYIIPLGLVYNIFGRDTHHNIPKEANITRSLVVTDPRVSLCVELAEVLRLPSRIR